MADTGDGFDPTFTMVSLLAAPRVDVLPPAGTQNTEQAGAPAAGPTSLPRGRALVLGGDEVYPVSSTRNYEDRLKSLMRAAWEPGALAADEREPAVYALPGNHDWYDGLTAFLRVFAQRRMVGGWRSEQTRSYFAVKLPAHWWLVGVDTQLGTYLDGPQLEYFRRNLSAHLEPGDGVVVCAPTPTWVHTAEDDPDAFNSLHFFEHEVVRSHTDDSGLTRPTGASVRLWLTGDRHHYARYAEDATTGTPRQLVTCGLGGAYLAETHRLPERLVLPAPGSKMASADEPATFDLATRWPGVAQSRRLVRGLVGGPPHGLAFRNPGLWRLLGGVHALALLLQAFVLGLVQRTNPVLVLRNASPRDALDLGWQTAVWLAVAVAVAVLLPLLRGRAPRRPGEVLLAVVLQLVVSSASFAAVLAVPCRRAGRTGSSSASPSAARCSSPGSSPARRSRRTSSWRATTPSRRGRCRRSPSRTTKGSCGSGSTPTAGSPCTRSPSRRSAGTGTSSPSTAPRPTSRVSTPGRSPRPGCPPSGSSSPRWSSSADEGPAPRDGPFAGVRELQAETTFSPSTLTATAASGFVAGPCFTAPSRPNFEPCAGQSSSPLAAATVVPWWGRPRSPR